MGFFDWIFGKSNENDAGQDQPAQSEPTAGEQPGPADISQPTPTAQPDISQPDQGESTKPETSPISQTPVTSTLPPTTPVGKTGSAQASPPPWEQPKQEEG